MSYTAYVATPDKGTVAVEVQGSTWTVGDIVRKAGYSAEITKVRCEGEELDMHDTVSEAGVVEGTMLEVVLDRVTFAAVEMKGVFAEIDPWQPSTFTEPLLQIVQGKDWAFLEHALVLLEQISAAGEDPSNSIRILREAIVGDDTPPVIREIVRHCTYLGEKLRKHKSFHAFAIPSPKKLDRIIYSIGPVVRNAPILMMECFKQTTDDHKKCFKMLLRNGFDLNVRCDEELWLGDWKADSNASPTMFMLLLRYCPLTEDDLNVIFDPENSFPVRIAVTDRRGSTPLMHAARNSARGVTVPYLISKGADLHMTDVKGRTALHFYLRTCFAAEENCMAGLEALRSSLTSPDVAGRPPSFYAVKTRHSVEVLQFALSAPDIHTVRDKNNNSILMHSTMHTDSFTAVLADAKVVLSGDDLQAYLLHKNYIGIDVTNQALRRNKVDICVELHVLGMPYVAGKLSRRRRRMNHITR